MAKAAVLKDFAGAVSSFFGNVRIPASIITGSSLGLLFAKPFGNSSDRRTSLELVLIKVYRLLCWKVFVLALNVVITSTVASTEILKGEFDPMAETAFVVLQREFPYEFLATQLSFLCSVFLFIIVVTIRMLLEFELLVDPERRDTGKFVICTSIAFLVNLLAFVNPRTLVTMVYDLAIIIWTQGSSSGQSLLHMVSIMAVMGALYFGLKSAIAHNSKPKEE